MMQSEMLVELTPSREVQCSSVQLLSQGALRFLATRPRGQQSLFLEEEQGLEVLGLNLDSGPPWGTLGSHLSLSLGRQKMSLLRAVYLGRKQGKCSRCGWWLRSQQVSARQSAQIRGQRGQGHWLGPLLSGGLWCGEWGGQDASGSAQPIQLSMVALGSLPYK